MVRVFFRKFLMVAGLAFLTPGFVFALQDGAARTPPMGFNTWNFFGCDGCKESNMLAVAKSLLQVHPANWEGKSICLKDVGYKYINLDDCWENGSGGHPNNDTLRWDATRFPKGLPWLTDTLHKMGFMAGLYTCAGTSTCAGRPSSQGYEAKDALTFVKWGFNYLKDDWCNATNGLTSPQAYSRMGHGLVDAQKQLGVQSTFIFSLCCWGCTGNNDCPWMFGDSCGHLWRTTGDIAAAWAGNASYGSGVQACYLLNYNRAHQYSGPGRWNDADMLEVGNGSLTPAQNQSHFDLWCIAASPLLLGNNTPSMTEATFTILSNREIVAVDQDSLGKAGNRVLGNGSSVDIYVKTMKTTDTTKYRKAAVCAINWTGSAAGAQTITWAYLGEKNAAQAYTVRDLHAHKDLSTTAAGSFTTDALPAYGTQLLLFTSNAVTDVLADEKVGAALHSGKLLTRGPANAVEFYVPRANSMIRVFSLSGKEILSGFIPTATWYSVNNRALHGTYIIRISGNNYALEGKIPMLAR